MDGGRILHMVRLGLKKRSLAGLLLISAGLGIVIFGLYLYLPVGYDFYHWYWPVPRAWLSGETRLYDEASRGFYLPPWTVWLLLPVSVVDIRIGMVGLTLLSLAMALYVSFAYLKGSGVSRPLPVALLAALCPYCLQVYFVGTLDALSLMGVFLAWRGAKAGTPWLLGLGTILALTRPQNAVLTGPVLLLGMRGWSAREMAQAAAIPVLVMLATFIGFGLDWPLRWWQNLHEAPPIPYLVTSSYDALKLLGVPYAFAVLGCAGLTVWTVRRAWKSGVNAETLNITVVVNAIVSPYMLSQSYLLLLALPWARLAARRPLLAAVPYLMSIPLLFRAQAAVWDTLGLWDAAFPLVLLVALLVERGMGSAGEGGRRLDQ